MLAKNGSPSSMPFAPLAWPPPALQILFNRCAGYFPCRSATRAKAGRVGFSVLSRNPLPNHKHILSQNWKGWFSSTLKKPIAITNHKHIGMEGTRSHSSTPILSPGHFGSSRELRRGEGPTPVDHTNSPYGTSVPSLRTNLWALTSLTIPQTRRTPDWEKVLNENWIDP